jgi:hypothetical protein
MKNKIRETNLLWTGSNGRRRGTVALFDDSMEVVSVVKINEDNNTEEEIIQKKTAPKKPEKNIAKVGGEKKKGGCSSCAKRGLLGLIKGSANLLKSELGIDAADEKTIAKRKALCIACEAYDFGVCNDCGCFTAAKVKLKTGSPCPKGKW